MRVIISIITFLFKVVLFILAVFWTMLVKLFHWQWCSWNTVKPVQKWDFKRREFHIISYAGTIKYRPKKEKEVSKFRDEIINKFEVIKFTGNLFAFYRQIRNKYKVSYSANLRTRLKGMFKCYLKV